MSTINFSIRKNKVTETIYRSFSIDDVYYCVGPLVHIEKKTGNIYVTAHFLSDVKEEDITITNKRNLDNTLDIYIEIAKKGDVENELLTRSHWEFSLLPKDAKDTLSLNEIEVTINFNESTDETEYTEPISAIDRLALVKDFVDEIQIAGVSEEQAISLISKINEMTIGNPRRGTRFIPPK